MAGPLIVLNVSNLREWLVMLSFHCAGRSAALHGNLEILDYRGKRRPERLVPKSAQVIPFGSSRQEDQRSRARDEELLDLATNGEKAC
jgi:hypothetical protein